MPLWRDRCGPHASGGSLVTDWEAIVAWALAAATDCADAGGGDDGDRVRRMLERVGLRRTEAFGACRSSTDEPLGPGAIQSTACSCPH